MSNLRNNANLFFILKMQSISFFIVLLAALSSCATKKEISKNEINSTLELAAREFKYLAMQGPEGQFPKTYNFQEDSLDNCNSDWGLSGFLSGYVFTISMTINRILN